MRLRENEGEREEKAIKTGPYLNIFLKRVTK